MQTIVTMFCSLTYLLLALGTQATLPYGGDDLNWLHYADWVFTTPLLLVRFHLQKLVYQIYVFCSASDLEAVKTRIKCYDYEQPYAYHLRQRGDSFS